MLSVYLVEEGAAYRRFLPQRLIWLAVILLLALVASSWMPSTTVAAPTYHPVASDAGAKTKHEPAQPKKKQPKVKTTSARPSAGTVSVAAVALPHHHTTPDCQPADFAPPAPVELASQSAGVHIAAGTIDYYEVYGASAKVLERQIDACAPNDGSTGRYAGLTSYYLNWSFVKTPLGDGKCTISDEKVGLNVQTILPAWQPDGAPKSLVAGWNKFVASLGLHEQGHASLDEQGADQLLQRLQALAPDDCGAITQKAMAIGNNQLAKLKSENESYDNRTNHGATQGAIIP